MVTEIQDDWLPPEYRVTIVGGTEPNDRVTLQVDHRPTWRRKGSTCPRHYAEGMAACLKQDIESDLLDVHLRNLLDDYGIFTPPGERD
ncbi:hypothetical protein [Microvirga splendida]|uniref:Uncharacterized protein n=1 Tax=Microvirga splendida TaxID=2795727 RepID=A0ABS0XZD0_9HYPH|nr:hypothetical protein [Microvirga splendida]MBJ6125414.1 hypothetical protein [Microvirga splendida]